METYVFESGKSQPSLKRQALSVLLFASVYFLVMLAFTFLWPSPYEKQESVYRIALKVVFISVFWGVAMSFVPKKIPRCKLLVDDQSIISVIEYTGWMKWYKIRKTVAAGKVRTIREINGRLGMPGGLAASERSGLGTWMLGGIYIPKNLPEYEQLRALVESWRAPGSAD